MKKTIKYPLAGLVLIECVLAWVHAPFVSIPTVLVTVGAVLVFRWMVGMYHAQMKDRQDERRFWFASQQLQHETQRYSFGLFASHANETQKQLVQTYLGMGALLTSYQGRPYAQLPTGTKFNISDAEAVYWQEIAPAQVTKALQKGRD